MRKIILAPDSYKGTMSAIEICAIMEEEIRLLFPECEVVSVPVADGGEGTVDCFLRARPGRRVDVAVQGPYFEEISSFYGLMDDGETAMIEMAAAAGLPMVEGRKNPEKTTTYGVGQLAAHAIGRGAKKIIVGIGGSCTNDGGCGMAAALGVRFFDERGEEFIPVGGTLDRIRRIDRTGADRLLSGVQLIAMCDVTNPLYGKNGAAFVFSPQKGADPAMVERLDRGLRRYGEHLSAIPGREGACLLPGGGAAGGLGAGMYALLGASLTRGIDAVLDTVGFEALLSGCDMVFTGEGRIDRQSLGGKVVMGIARRAKPFHVPVCAIVGDALDGELEEAYGQGLTSVFAINRLAIPFEEAKLRARNDLRETVKNILRMLHALGIRKHTKE